jgi:erythronate-4-phosphate dehydrogenase
VRILADENIPGLRAWFAGWGEVRTHDGRTLAAADLADSDVLLVRSVTRVDAKLLAGSRVKFVGTATAGVDHIDQDYLAAQRIRFAAAPGCNARAVAEHILACCLYHALRSGRALTTLEVGIIGVGHVGRAVAALLCGLGLRCLLHDPPRARAGTLATHVGLEETLAADVVTLHVPLVEGGSDPTRHLIDAGRIAQLKSGALLINAARGGVVDEAAWLARDDASLRLAVDCFVAEPAPSAEVIADAMLASPHVAGHTVEARWRATGILARALADFAGSVSPVDKPVPSEGCPAPRTVRSLSEAIFGAWDPAVITETMRALPLSPSARGPAFDALRRHCGARREFQSHRLEVADTALASTLRGLGFALSA